MAIRYFEVRCGVKANPSEKYDCEIRRGLVDAGYSIAIKADHYPTIEETEEFIQTDLRNLDYAGVYDIAPLTEQEVFAFFDTGNIEEWPILYTDGFDAGVKAGKTELLNELLGTVLEWKATTDVVSCSTLMHLLQERKNVIEE